MAKKKEVKEQSVAERARALEDVIWIVNPGGALHLVTREHAREKFREVGWRKATPAEIAELDKRKGNQRFDDPIAEPWSPEPAESSDEQ